MQVEIDNQIWNNDINVISRSIYIYCLINHVNESNDEFLKSMIDYTKCYEKSVKKAINNLIDLNVIKGDKYELDKKVEKDNSLKPESQSIIDKFVAKYKKITYDKYKEYCSKYSKILANDAMGLVIACFRRNISKYKYFDSIPQNELIALYDVAIDYKRKTPEYESIRNPLAVITSKINELIDDIK